MFLGLRKEQALMCHDVIDEAVVTVPLPGWRATLLVCLRLVATAACAITVASLRQPRRALCQAVNGAETRSFAPGLRIRCAAERDTFESGTCRACDKQLIKQVYSVQRLHSLPGS